MIAGGRRAGRALGRRPAQVGEPARATSAPRPSRTSRLAGRGRRPPGRATADPSRERRRLVPARSGLRHPPTISRSDRRSESGLRARPRSTGGGGRLRRSADRPGRRPDRRAGPHPIATCPGTRPDQPGGALHAGPRPGAAGGSAGSHAGLGGPDCVGAGRCAMAAGGSRAPRSGGATGWHCRLTACSRRPMPWRLPPNRPPRMLPPPSSRQRQPARVRRLAIQRDPALPTWRRPLR